ncbi:25269_t:CDS:2 [Racocetra persica]|uniref:25269_t:CDS:1 n=1 Tax=Racocetra persica TaxID=160502 RepID=A0ACA9KUM4_9GLOM|nr:25269_t:CDS:2 [Racocetra persica]
MVKNRNKTEINDIIRNYLAMLFDLYNIQTMQLRCSISQENMSLSSTSIVSLLYSVPKIPANALAQKRAADKIKNTKKKFLEFEQIYKITTDPQLLYNICEKIENI